MQCVGTTINETDVKLDRTNDHHAKFERSPLHVSEKKPNVKMVAGHQSDERFLHRRM